MQKGSKKKLKAILAFLMLIFIIFGFGVGGAFLSKTPSFEPTKAPQEHILNENLSEEVESLLLSQGNVIIKINCENCAIDLLSVEGLVRKYNPYVYLIEETSSNNTVELLGYRESDIIYSINTTEIEDFICDNAAVRFQNCVLRNIQPINESIPI